LEGGGGVVRVISKNAKKRHLRSRRKVITRGTVFGEHMVSDHLPRTRV